MKFVIQALDIAKEAQQKDSDTVYAVVGRERSGKSHFALNCVEYLNGEIAGVVIDKDELGKSLNSLKEGGIFQFDEAADGLYSKDAMNKWNRNLEKLFMVIGAKKLISFFIIPDFFLLSPYFRKHRIHGLFWVYKRGKVAFYGRHEIEKINFIHDKYKTNKISGARPLFYDHFPIYKGRLIEEYTKKKMAKINSMIDTFDKATRLEIPMAAKAKMTKKDMIINMSKDGVDSKTISKALHANHGYVRDVIATCT